MKILQSSFFRALTAIIVGGLLILYRQNMMQWLTIAIGILFFLSGVISVAAYYSSWKTYKNNEGIQLFDTDGNQISGKKPNIPIVGIGSIILGIILSFMTASFINGMMYILATILILGAINMLINLATISKMAHIGIFYWIVPCIILLTGIFVMMEPMDAADTPLLIIGWCMILYGVIEGVSTIKIHQMHKSTNTTKKENKAFADIKDKDTTTNN
ncbi:MAG TPA: hypothetical protein DCS83_00485 [Prevotella sp.]|nr:hypothetical protein [Prevotella sp.]